MTTPTVVVKVFDEDGAEVSDALLLGIHNPSLGAMLTAVAVGDTLQYRGDCYRVLDRHWAIDGMQSTLRSVDLEETDKAVRNFDDGTTMKFDE